MYSNIKITGEITSLPKNSDVDELEKTLNTTLPIGYREYITTYGAGILGGSYIRIYTPFDILKGENHIQAWRKRIAEYWFWDEGKTLLSQAQALECVIIGDTLDGDELCFHPNDPDTLYILPRHEDKIYHAGNGLPETIEWLCSSGVLTEAFSEREFEPDDDNA